MNDRRKKALEFSQRQLQIKASREKSLDFLSFSLSKVDDAIWQASFWKIADFRVLSVSLSSAGRFSKRPSIMCLYTPAYKWPFSICVRSVSVKSDTRGDAHVLSLSLSLSFISQLEVSSVSRQTLPLANRLFSYIYCSANSVSSPVALLHKD